MQLVTSKLSHKHQIVIPKIARDQLGLKAGDTIVWKITNQTLQLASNNTSWTDYTKGLGKTAWEQIPDATKYVRSLRNEWPE